MTNAARAFFDSLRAMYFQPTYTMTYNADNEVLETVSLEGNVTLSLKQGKAQTLEIPGVGTIKPEPPKSK